MTRAISLIGALALACGGWGPDTDYGYCYDSRVATLEPAP